MWKELMLFPKTLDITWEQWNQMAFWMNIQKSNLDNTFEQQKHDDTTKQAQNPFTKTKIIVSKTFKLVDVWELTLFFCKKKYTHTHIHTHTHKVHIQKNTHVPEVGTSITTTPTFQRLFVVEFGRTSMCINSITMQSVCQAWFNIIESLISKWGTTSKPLVMRSIPWFWQCTNFLQMAYLVCNLHYLLIVMDLTIYIP
jgi:hypothetical protein